MTKGNSLVHQLSFFLTNSLTHRLFLSLAVSLPISEVNVTGLINVCVHSMGDRHRIKNQINKKKEKSPPKIEKLNWIFMGVIYSMESVWLCHWATFDMAHTLQTWLPWICCDWSQHVCHIVSSTRIYWVRPKESHRMKYSVCYQCIAFTISVCRHCKRLIDYWLHWDKAIDLKSIGPSANRYSIFFVNFSHFLPHTTRRSRCGKNALSSSDESAKRSKTIRGKQMNERKKNQIIRDNVI